jgi:CubicO group peptidase (beta-lactamase class C family)
MKSWNRTETWVGLFVLGIGAILAVVLGLHAYMSITATPLHADPESVPSVAEAAPPGRWNGAVERARKAMRQGLAEKNLPGLSVAIGINGDIVWAEGFGWADLDRRVKVTPSHRFRIGTASTALTSAAVGLLLEKNALNLDDDIQKHVPEFPRKEWPVTLRQLMGHTAGMRSDGGDEGPLFGQHCERPIEALSTFADRPLLFEPGTEYRFSRYDWIVMSAAIEAAAHEPFLSYMKKQIFEPLGMTSTREESTSEPIPDRAMFYFPRYAADPGYGEDPIRDIDLSCYAGASVFLSTPSDLVRFGMAMNGGTLLQPATVDLLQTSQRLKSGQETGYGLGWDLEAVTLAGQPAQAVGHDGDVLGGIVSSLMTFRDRGIVVAVTSNISYADTASLALSVAQAFAEEGSGSPQK